MYRFSLPINSFLKRALLGAFLLYTCSYATCKYGFRDATDIPPEVKTFRVNAFENRAQYVNTLLAPQLTEKTKQKIISLTRLKQTNDDEAHYDISGYISQYYTSTVGVSNGQASGNRLTVGFHVIFKNRLDEKKNMETDINRNFDYPATQSLTEAETLLTTEIIKNMSEDIFSKVFSNW